MNLFRSEEHARRWAQFNPASGEGFIPAERREYLTRIGKTTRFWLGTPSP